MFDILLLIYSQCWNRLSILLNLNKSCWYSSILLDQLEQTPQGRKILGILICLWFPLDTCPFTHRQFISKEAGIKTYLCNVCIVKWQQLRKINTAICWFHDIITTTTKLHYFPLARSNFLRDWQTCSSNRLVYWYKSSSRVITLLYYGLCFTRK